MAAELTSLKMYWAYSLTGMHDLAMRQVIDGADALVSITSGPTKVQVRTAHCSPDTKLTVAYAYFISLSLCSLGTSQGQVAHLAATLGSILL